MCKRDLSDESEEDMSNVTKKQCKGVLFVSDSDEAECPRVSSW